MKNQFETTVKRLDEDLTLGREALELAQAQVAELSHDNGQLEGARDATNAELERLRLALSALEGEKATLVDAAEARDVEWGEAKVKIGGLEEDLARALGDLDEARSRESDLRAKIEQVSGLVMF